MNKADEKLCCEEIFDMSPEEIQEAIDFFKQYEDIYNEIDDMKEFWEKKEDIEYEINDLKHCNQWLEEELSTKNEFLNKFVDPISNETDWKLDWTENRLYRILKKFPNGWLCLTSSGEVFLKWRLSK
jgi:hypothetical protein